jgi:hypothetical protein
MGAPPHFWGSHFRGKASLWPGGKELVRKKHRPGGPSSRRLRAASAGCGGPIGRPAGRPYKERTPSLGVRAVCPPGP